MREVLIVVVGALWALGVWFLVGRLAVGLLSIALRRWRHASRTLGRRIYPTLALLVVAGLAAHLIVGSRLPVAPPLDLHAVWWVVPAGLATAGAALCLESALLALGGDEEPSRALIWRGGLLLATGAAACAVVALVAGLWPLAAATGLVAAAALVSAGSKKALPGGRIVAIAWALSALLAR